MKDRHVQSADRRPGVARPACDDASGCHRFQCAVITAADGVHAGPLSRVNFNDVPVPGHFQARGGTGLQYYAYPAASDKVAFLVHGSVGPGTTMHALAKALRDAEVSAYVLDIRGHGGSGRRGDIDYIGQIDDDLADFARNLGSAKSGEVRTLIGFSAGGGFTIRFAGGPHGELFDRYIFLSPILPGAPSLRANAGGDEHLGSACRHDRFARSPRDSRVRRI